MVLTTSLATLACGLPAPRDTLQDSPSARRPPPSPAATATAAAARSALAAVELPAAPAGAERLRVVRVVDGDTFVARSPGGRQASVRLVGVDAPEHSAEDQPGECYAEQATRYVRERLDGRTVLAARDVSELDRYGRQLRLVWLEDGRTFMNAELVARGMARAVVFPPDATYAETLRHLEQLARAGHLGLWGACR